MGAKQSRDDRPLLDSKSICKIETKSSSAKLCSLYDSIAEDWPWVWAIRDTSLLDWKQGLSDDEIQVQAKRQQRLPVKIMEGVYLGSALSVQNVEKLQYLGITAVLNMAGTRALKEETINEFVKMGIAFKQINADDEPFFPVLENHWQEAYDFIQSSVANGNGKCVVHCVAGINRSAVIVAAYYMITTQTPLLDTIKHIRSQRGNMAVTNEGFQQQIVAMARLNNLLGIRPGETGSIVHRQPPPPPDGEWVFAPLKKKYNPLDRLTF
mmetsp:Transcript_15574/g.31093  ORF Transcript_15574/g.31093 Transcript_15574/m.31093 type:complete len:267 (+) Transcript_15574:178-978(+)